MHGRVVSTEWLTPALVRVVLGGGDLEHVEMPDATDAYVNLAIPPAGAPYGGVFSPAKVKDAARQGALALAPSLHDPELGRGGARADPRLRRARH